MHVRTDRQQLLAAILIAIAVPAGASAVPHNQPNCHFLPGDASWPSHQEWKHLNESVGGRLIAGTPLAQVCHGTNTTGYNANACTEIQSKLTQSSTYFEDPVAVMYPYWQNDSCSAFSSPSSPCTLGYIASYALNVSSATDIVAGFKFAEEKNIRLTVKNTGHDYLGRSTGEGALALWTHNLKNISFFNYTSNQYTGPAVKLGAGIQAYEAYQAAADHGVRITGGFCVTVGIVGGYVQGGGHGPLEGMYGLAADNTLEFEVVTPDGRHLVATPTNNSDLYWALNGGGGSTYAVVLSQTTKAHVDGPVAGATITVNGANDDKYWSAIEAWQKNLLVFDSIPALNTFWTLTNESFNLLYATFPGANASVMATTLDPFIQELNRLGLVYSYSVSGNATYYEHFKQYNTNLPFGVFPTNLLAGGRLIQRSTVQKNLTNLVATFRNITNTGTGQFQINGIASNVSHERVGNTASSNSVLPAWRDSLYTINMDVPVDPTATVETIRDLQAQMNEKQNQLKVLTPGGGAYMNEGTFDNPEWKEDYYGVNYDRLLSIKKKYDPNFILYGPAAVGSDFWSVASDGRLCRAN